MVETASQVAARQALTGKGEAFDETHPPSPIVTEGKGEPMRRVRARRGRYRQRKKRKDRVLAKDASTAESDVSISMMCALDYDACKKMVEAPEIKSEVGCSQSDTRHQKHRQEPHSPRATTEMLSDMGREGKKTDRRWPKHGKKIDLIRKGQSGWAGAGFDRSPSPSSLPMPPSDLLERACQNDISATSFYCHFVSDRSIQPLGCA